MSLTRADRFDLMLMLDTYADDCEERCVHASMPGAMRAELRRRIVRAQQLSGVINKELSIEAQKEVS